MSVFVSMAGTGACWKDLHGGEFFDRRILLNGEEV
jgi:hypothetical protein